jgi:HD-GYP domain-containing protein (c-di-GMP phosphodiesterase class II)
MPHSKAIDEILRNAGGQFDPAVVRVFADAERQGLIDEEQRNGHGRESVRPVLQRREMTVPAASPDTEPVPEETVPAGGE